MGNVARLHQDGDVELSEIGLMQAERVAHRFVKIGFEKILSSDFKRARQTAEAIAKATDKEIELVKELREIKKPSEIEGKHVDMPEVVEIKKMQKQHNDDPDWHYSDEENFTDLLNRAGKFVKKLEKRKERELVVVTHGTVLRAIVSVMSLGDKVDATDLAKIQRLIWKMDNTGISVVGLVDGKWWLKNWNDSAHLG